MDLQLIETATKDGGARLVLTSDEFGGQFYVAWWRGDGWEAGVPGGTTFMVPGEVTHWAELPEKP